MTFERTMQPAGAGGAQAQHAAEEANEKGWRLSYSVQPEEVRSVAMPEPQHRLVVPALLRLTAATSGMIQAAAAAVVVEECRARLRVHIYT